MTEPVQGGADPLYDATGALSTLWGAGPLPACTVKNDAGPLQDGTGAARDGESTA